MIGPYHNGPLRLFTVWEPTPASGNRIPTHRVTIHRMTDTQAVYALECYNVVDLSEPAAFSRASNTPLTARELEIVQLLAEGKSNKQAASELGISVRTAESHRRHVMQKLRIRSVVELVFYAIERGIVPGATERYSAPCQPKP